MTDDFSQPFSFTPAANATIDRKIGELGGITQAGRDARAAIINTHLRHKESLHKGSRELQRGVHRGFAATHDRLLGDGNLAVLIDARNVASEYPFSKRNDRLTRLYDNMETLLSQREGRTAAAARYVVTHARSMEGDPAQNLATMLHNMLVGVEPKHLLYSPYLPPFVQQLANASADDLKAADGSEIHGQDLLRATAIMVNLRVGGKSANR